MTKDSDKYQKGWLFIIGLIIIIWPILRLLDILPSFTAVFTNGSWTALTTPGNKSYNLLWASMIIGEIIVNLSFLILWIFMGVLFFRKKKAFIIWCTCLLLTSIFLILINSLATKLLVPEKHIFDPDTTRGLIRGAIGAGIWITYLLKSKVVKEIFVN